jgi:hypothetical protein
MPKLQSKQNITASLATKKTAEEISDEGNNELNHRVYLDINKGKTSQPKNSIHEAKRKRNRTATRAPSSSSLQLQLYSKSMLNLF